jgi:hypothetical protein
MIQRLAASTRRRDQDGKILLHLILPDQIGQHLRTQGVIHTVVGFGFGVEGTGFGHRQDYTCNQFG